MNFLKNYLDWIIFGSLGLMAFLVLWFTIERLWYYRQIDYTNYKSATDLKIKLTQHLTLIASIGANAPYVGLLGTVLGILVTFYDMGLNQDLEVSQIMIGLALALKATAAGIALAIPTIMIYNGFIRKVDVITSQYNETLAG